MVMLAPPLTSRPLLPVYDVPTLPPMLPASIVMPPVVPDDVVIGVPSGFVPCLTSRFRSPPIWTLPSPEMPA